jgi:hypothetical protein
MPNTPPIKLGSARVGGLILQTGSSSKTSDSGIDEATVIALYGGGPIGANTRGRPYSAFFDNGFLPDTFLSDSIETEYLEGQIIRATIVFKRPNPNLTGRTHARIYVDSVINYKSLLSPILWTGVAANGEAQDGVFGFPEPVVTVKYNSTTQPGIGSGGLATLYALPGSTTAAGFPTVPDISIPYSPVLPVGSIVTYFNGTTFISAGPLTAPTTFNFNLNFKPNSRGWQLTRLKADPVSDQSFYDVEEDWRNYYFFFNTTFINRVPP